MALVLESKNTGHHWPNKKNFKFYLMENGFLLDFGKMPLMKVVVC